MMKVSTNKWIGKLLTVLAFMLMKFPTNYVLFPLHSNWLKMSTPVVKLNTFVGRKHVDNISKMFIILSFFLGVNRIIIIENVKTSYFYLSLAYSCTVTSIVTGFGIFVFFQGTDNMIVIDVFKYTTISVLIFALRERLQRFYKELDQFDEKIGYNEKITRNSIQTLIQMSSILTMSLFFFWLYLKQYPVDYEYIYYVVIVFLPLTLMHCFELYYLGHLIGMFSPRIRLVSFHIKLSYPVNDCDSTIFCDDPFMKFKKEMKRKSKIEMGDLMDLYYGIIKAYDYLNEAVKWQLLILLIATFVTSMGVAYEVSMNIISGNFLIEECLADISLIFLEIFPMFTICFFADQVCREVNNLRDTLSSSLYENSLDKSTRTSAQAFLGLTEARDLSFSLFNMFNIGITLPFNFLSLLLTYLIILLQFQKVITPSVRV